MRATISASFPLLFLVILLRDGFASAPLVSWGTSVDIAEWAILGAASLVVASGLIWARRAGLALDQSLRLLLGATLDSPRWDEPAFRRVLAPASGKVRAPEGDTPSDYLRAIREILPFLLFSGGDARLRAGAAAERVVDAIGQRDSELAKLSRDAGPEEENRLASQLDALDAGGGDTQEHAELRELVRHQLELVRRMRGRRELILGDRAHLIDLLRGLWILVRACSDSQGGESPEVERLQALCAKIRVELSEAAA
ncbi:MAG TPA: hypothetical protein VGJ64_01570 [Gemmatimonadaceae bacterium]